MREGNISQQTAQEVLGDRVAYLDHIKLCNAVLLYRQWQRDAVLLDQHCGS